MNVVIIGRENVGKSTLFNCLIKNRKALTSKEAGTTRDAKYAPLQWRGVNFTLIDTAGIKIKPETVIDKAVQNKIISALDEADVILFIVDGQTGIVAQDRQIAKIIQKQNKPYLLAVNKIDTPKMESTGAEFIKLGIGKLNYISAINGLGTGDLLDKIIQIAPKTKKEKTVSDYKDRLKIAIIGQPNVGKSSLLNALLGEEKVIVTEIPHTTREPNDIPFTYKKEKILLIDTAGLRRKKQKKTLDALSMQITTQTIKNCDIVLLVLDATQNISSQDQRIAGLAQDNKKGMIIVVNKWDLIVDKDTKTIEEYKKYFSGNLPFLKAVPFIFVSAKTKLRTNKILDLVLTINKEMNKIIDQKDLDKLLKQIVKKKKPVQAKGPKRPRIILIEQDKTNPPRFNIVIGKKDSLHFSYIRFIENQIRDRFQFLGTPVNFNITKAK